MAKKDNQEKFLEAYAKCYGNITKACEAVGIDRRTYYTWTDPEFQQRLAAVKPDEILVDHAENALVKRIDSGDTTAIIFTLKTKGKHRGYIEKQQVENVSDPRLDAVKKAIETRADQTGRTFKEELDIYFEVSPNVPKEIRDKLVSEAVN